MKPSLPLLLLSFVMACAPATPPPTRETLVLTGTAYDRGLQHGTQLRSKIRSFYTTLMTNSLFPFLSREQPDIATLLKEYDADRYKNGGFARELLLDSAKNLERNLGRSGRDELRGIADGSGLTYEEVLILNTFVDTTLAVRGIGLAIRQGRAPVVESVEFLGLGSDRVDNSGEGTIDETDEGVIKPFVPPYFAAAVEIDVRTKLRVTFSDPDGVDPQTVRVRMNEGLFIFGDPSLEIVELDATHVQLTFTPIEPLPAASTITFVVSAGDKRIIEIPGPPRASFRRDEEFVVTTRGAGLAPRDISRPALTDNRTRPPPFTLGVRGSRAASGPLLAHSFALLDANTAHKHTVLLMHRPDTGPAYATVGWAGIVYGISGLNERGVGVACNPSDTLDNSVVGSVLDQVADLSRAKLLASGLPVGFLVKRVLERASNVAEGIDALTEIDPVYGWNCTIADDQGGLEVVELDSDVFKQGQGGVYRYGPTDLDPSMRRYSSLTDDDVISGSSYTRNVDDSITLNLAGQRVVPQRFWSGFFFRSRRVIDNVSRRLAARTEPVDVPWLEALLAEPEVIDRSDSMNAVVLDLKNRTVHSAMGTIPATASPFVATELGR
ncbi:MAG: carcinine hydrolase/isopenicillin-N N-acyltransferase family protein [Myxococcales bacterium]|nr:carcinine hydrolase/isopenicillin-N N-acyltransferase family protein [Myxococcales bacterium]